MNDAPALPPIETAPRYTSYPTAPHFHSSVGPQTLAAWIAAIPPVDEVSLYLHIPYCDQLCWFCACNTKHTTRYHVVETYLASLKAEIAAVAARLPKRVRVSSVHYGGGSPTILTPDDLTDLDRALRGAFTLTDDAEVSIEIDPRDMDEGRYDALARIGATRASIGVQDFDTRVQAAINRHQSFAMTREAVVACRARGIASVNLDLVYGLPLQTVTSVSATVAEALTLKPDRIALFGYAHVPWFKKHQTQIRPEWLPGPEDRLDQSAAARTLILGEAYDPVGLDHFALPPDSLSLAARTGRLRRNFQGYTADRATTLIGLGASSVSQFPQGYAQNATAAAVYERMIGAGTLATARGIALTDDDRVRGWIIERLMCDFGFSTRDALGQFGAAAKSVLTEAERIAAAEGGTRCLWNDGAFRITAAGRPFVRQIAARFDAYLRDGPARHSLAV
ncbi:oxygen-independent coproporphyrinogen III oxidase [Ensifer soli]|uniref:oxygen-independent coproporphyrinogen III oxidase n=1 Tax=Ciceribacter sp. sgz301302 TaxID=3342379 RepID=UPI0035B73570